MTTIMMIMKKSSTTPSESKRGVVTELQSEVFDVHTWIINLFSTFALSYNVLSECVFEKTIY
jgi:hypothetical protein